MAVCLLLLCAISVAANPWMVSVVQSGRNPGFYIFSTSKSAGETLPCTNVTDGLTCSGSEQSLTQVNRTNSGLCTVTLLQIGISLASPRCGEIFKDPSGFQVTINLTFFQAPDPTTPTTITTQHPTTTQAPPPITCHQLVWILFAFTIMSFVFTGVVLQSVTWSAKHRRCRAHELE